MGIRWRCDYGIFYGTPNKSRESDESDKGDTERHGPVYIETYFLFIFPVLKYGSDIEEPRSQEINWNTNNRCMDYISSFKEFKRERRTLAT